MNELILKTIFLFLPAFLANATPVVVKNIPGMKTWNRPIWEKGFGKNKTWRGFLLGILLAMLTATIQFAYFPELLPVAASVPTGVLIGFLLGSGALCGDIAESYIKRRMGLTPGKPLPVWDGVDYILGALLFLSPVFVPDIRSAIILIVISPILSLASNTVSYFLGWKNVWH